MGVIITKMRYCASETALTRKVACGGWALCLQNGAFSQDKFRANSNAKFKVRLRLKFQSS